MEAVSLAARPSPEARCAICHDALERAHAVDCAACKTSVHASCGVDLGRCPTIGCTRNVTPSGRVASRPIRIVPVSRLRLLALLGATLGAFAIPYALSFAFDASILRALAVGGIVGHVGAVPAWLAERLRGPNAGLPALLLQLAIVSTVVGVLTASGFGVTSFPVIAWLVAEPIAAGLHLRATRATPRD